MESKKDIRKRVLAMRNSISKREWEEKTCRIYQTVITHPFFLAAGEIYCYMDYRNEVGTRKIIEAAWKRKKKVAIPKISKDIMEFYYIESFGELSCGSYGIMEPKDQNPANGESGLILMPGAVFDRQRNRIGYGKAYYDRYLLEHSGCHTMALAFEFQVLDKIPADVHDICPQIIVTEEKIYV